LVDREGENSSFENIKNFLSKKKPTTNSAVAIGVVGLLLFPYKIILML